MKESRIIAAIALLASAVCLGSCGEKENSGLEPVPGEQDSGYTVAGVKINDYSIVYALPGTTNDADNVAKDIADDLKTAVFKNLKVSISAVASGTREKEHEILIGNTNRQASKTEYAAKADPFDYKISVSDGKLVISGGEWGIRHAANILLNDYIKPGKIIPADVSISGNARGKQLFARPLGNLRIFDDNIWLYDKNEIPDVWQAAGEDPRNSFRGIQFADVVASFMPDVFCFQEYSKAMEAVFLPRIKGYGYSKCVASQQPNFTPVFYNPETVAVEKDGYVLFTPAKWSNSSTKSFTWAVFKLKASGRLFAVVSTHLWYKSDTEEPGSTQARCDQVNVIRAKVAEIEKEYGCPVFVAGDMNCNLSSSPMGFFLNDGYEPCPQIATVFKDGRRGKNTCAASGFSGPSVESSTENGVRAIDQFFVHNRDANTGILSFRRIYADFIYSLTDHCPNYCDISLI